MKWMEGMKRIGLLVITICFSGSLLAQEQDSAAAVLGDEFNTKPLRNDYAVKREDNKERTPLAYQYIRPKDAVWGKRVWEEIDTREKMNHPFVYEGEDEQGNSMMLINILVQAVLDGEITAFKGVDDRFTTPLTLEEVNTELKGQADTIPVTDPITGEVTQEIIRNDFNPEMVKSFRIKEDWVFDRQTSRLYCRIIGIAPLEDKLDPETGELRGRMPLFWLYYPDLRPVLAQYDVYNPDNFYQHITWEDLFEMRRFNGQIVKVDNSLDRTIEEEIPGNSQEAGIKRLLKGREIHNKIFDFEQSLWVY